MELSELTLKVRELAVATGAFIREERKKFSRERIEKKHAHDYVSVDKESERRIVACLRELLPEAGFIAEEGSGTHTDEEYCWLVDPLDGTTNFIHNHAPYCVSIALRNREEILLGVVYEVCRDECFWTYKGAPAYCNDRQIRVSRVAVPDELIEGCYGHVAGIRVVGAAAAEMCYVADGRFEARAEAFTCPWDVAAGILLVQNAGGRVTDFSGGDSCYSGREVVASNGKVHDFLLNLLG